MKPDIDKDGYEIIRITNAKEGKKNTYKMHRLVLYSFKPDADKTMQVNHIDGNKRNNNLDNLETVNNRENGTHKFIGKNKTSKYAGVSWVKHYKCWRAQVQVNKKKYHLGHFNCETTAYLAYVKYLNENNLINKYV
jgi:hypothetical protein